jgi:hypothetical protein
MGSIDPSQAADERLIDLVIKELGENLSDTEMRSLESFDASRVGRLRGELERAAAAVTLAAHLPYEPLPVGMQARLERQAVQFLAGGLGAPSVSGSPDALTAPGGMSSPVMPTIPAASAARSPSPRTSPAGWWAAAACLVLAVLGWLRSPPPSAPTPSAGEHQTAPTPAARRAQLIASGRAQRADIPAGADPAAPGVTGDVVWDPVSQSGYLRFVGLKPNDPAVQQYQIWVFDADRDQRYPVDGGVFDVPAGDGDVVIPIRVAVPVRAAKAFAVTVEKPGGVVVSAREHIVALAQLT